MEDYQNYSMHKYFNNRGYRWATSFFLRLLC